MTDLDAKVTELEGLLAAADFTEPLTVSYTELGRLDDLKLYAFLMEGDPEDGVHVAVDEEPTGTDVPSPRLEAIAALVNAAPDLIADWKRLKATAEYVKDVEQQNRSQGREVGLLKIEVVEARIFKNKSRKEAERLKAERDAMAEALRKILNECANVHRQIVLTDMTKEGLVYSIKMVGRLSKAALESSQ